jgi:transposase
MLRIGRLKERYKCISFAYNIEIQEQNTTVVGLSFTKDSQILNKRISGQYCINSNIKDLNAVELWNKYTTLTEIESTFRSLKSELGLRPIYHQKDSRIEGHIFLTLLAYHIIHTIRYQLKQQNINYSYDSIKK